MTQEERIKCLEAEVEHWKKVAAGLKGHNRKLTELAEHYKALDLEGDELNEEKAARINAQGKAIEGLEQQVLSLSRELSEKNTEISVLRIEVKRQSETIAHITRKPWYKRMFSKGE